MSQSSAIFTLHIEGSEIHSISDFYQQVNVQLMVGEDWKLGESLDAFDDLLYGAYGAWKDADKKQIVWHDSQRSAKYLGVKTTLVYYRSKLGDNKRFNQSHVNEKIRLLEGGGGETYYEMLVSIIEDHADTIELVRK